MSARTLTTIIHLLELYPDVNHPATTADRIQVAETRTSPMLSLDPQYHQGTFRELEEALRHMRKNGRQKAHRGESLATLYFHINGYYLNHERIQKWRQLRDLRHPCRSCHGRPNNNCPKCGWVLETRRHPQALKAKALLGAEYIDDVWHELAETARRQGRPFRTTPQLPPDQLKQAA
jgi:glutaredoxin